MPDSESSRTDQWLKFGQLASVVVGVLITVLSFNAARSKEADARKASAEAEKLELQKYNDQKVADQYKAQIESAQPFLELRQKRYLDAVHSAGILATPNDHTQAEITAAKKSFSELYYADLALVEETDVARAMEAFKNAMESTVPLTSRQAASLQLAHILRDSLTRSWGVSDSKTGEIPFKPSKR